jgi:RHS repeat-associated protein
MHYFWDQLNPVPQLATEREDIPGSPGVWSATYTYGAHRIGMNTGGASYYYHYDGLGSVANLTSATGATQWTYAYEPFGATRTQSQNAPNAPTNSFKFTGEYLDSLSFYALRAREYDPTNGRFTTVDPLGGAADSQPQSLYVYANDDPTQFTDPTGRGPSAPATDFPDATSEATSPADDDSRVLAMHDPGGGGSPPLWGLPFPLTTHFDGPDQGVDYRPTHAVKAIGAGHIYHHSPPGSFKTPFGDGEAVYEHLDRPVHWGGHTYYNIYYSEQASIVKSGPVVVGQPVMIHNADELGFAKKDQSNARPHGKLVHAPGGWTYPTVEGCDFYNFLYWIERSYLKLPPSPKKRCYPVVPYQPD